MRCGLWPTNSGPVACPHCAWLDLRRLHTWRVARGRINDSKAGESEHLACEAAKTSLQDLQNVALQYTRVLTAAGQTQICLASHKDELGVAPQFVLEGKEAEGDAKQCSCGLRPCSRRLQHGSPNLQHCSEKVPPNCPKLQS